VSRGRLHVPDSELTLTFARSSGPGGQHVNTADTKVTLRWEVASSPSIPEDVRQRFLRTYATRITADGTLVLMCQTRRSRQANVDACKGRLHEMLAAVERAPKTRKKTSPSKGAMEARLRAKKRRADVKRQRRPPESE
jgi:ribosome-associated protein